MRPTVHITAVAQTAVGIKDKLCKKVFVPDEVVAKTSITRPSINVFITFTSSLHKVYKVIAGMRLHFRLTKVSTGIC